MDKSLVQDSGVSVSSFLTFEIQNCFEPSTSSHPHPSSTYLHILGIGHMKPIAFTALRLPGSQEDIAQAHLGDINSLTGSSP